MSDSPDPPDGFSPIASGAATPDRWDASEPLQQQAQAQPGHFHDPRLLHSQAHFQHAVPVTFFPILTQNPSTNGATPQNETPDELAERVQRAERRIAELEAQLTINSLNQQLQQLEAKIQSTEVETQLGDSQSVVSESASGSERKDELSLARIKMLETQPKAEHVVEKPMQLEIVGENAECNMPQSQPCTETCSQDRVQPELPSDIDFSFSEPPVISSDAPISSDDGHKPTFPEMKPLPQGVNCANTPEAERKAPASLKARRRHKGNNGCEKLSVEKQARKIHKKAPANVVHDDDACLANVGSNDKKQSAANYWVLALVIVPCIAFFANVWHSSYGHVVRDATEQKQDIAMGGNASGAQSIAKQREEPVQSNRSGGDTNAETRRRRSIDTMDAPATTFGKLSPDSNKWWSAVLASNGFIYGIPCNAGAVLRIDPRTDTFTTIGNLGNEPFKWIAGVISLTGIIYGIPASAQSVLRIDPDLEEVTTFGRFSAQTSKWTSGVVAANGGIYGVPNSASGVLKIDPTTDQLSTIGDFGKSRFKWASGVLATNGAIYGLPSHATAVLKINPALDTATTFGALPAIANKWHSGIMASNGAIYAVPNAIGQILKIDTASDNLALLGDLGGGTFKWMSSIMASNGAIYGIPASARSVLRIDTALDQITTFGGMEGDGVLWRSAEIGARGEIFAIPFNASFVLKIDPVSNTVAYCGAFGAHSNKWRSGVGTTGGLLYGVPLSASSVLRINTSTTTGCEELPTSVGQADKLQTAAHRPSATRM